MGKAKPTLPREIEANTRYAKIIYLVYKCQSWSLLLVKRTRKSQRAEKSLEKLCVDSLGLLLDPGEAGTPPTWPGLGVTGFQCPWCSLSSHFPISMAFLTMGDCFLRMILKEKMLQCFSCSSPDLGSKQDCREATVILIHFSVQLLHACVCTFIPWCISQKLQLGRSSASQIPPVISDTHGVTGSWCFPCFPHALSKGSRPGHPASWLGFCLGKVVLTMGTLGLCLMWQAGRNLCWVTRSPHFWAMKAALFPSRSCCLSSLWLGVAPCVWWRELCAPAGLFASPGSHAFSYTWAV